MIQNQTGKIDFEALKKSEWSSEFEKFMRNRLLMGSFRYGKIAEQDFTKYDFLSELDKRMKKYKETDNLEFLVDSANILMLEYIKGKRLGKKMKPIDDGEHSKVKR